ncbi:segregation/condensation protein B [Clostridium sp. YIM B02515]|uniref:Segregation and condensation protein B n=1 Tax=Clostridium rhizosphaerae TaxID=2803861 RepID=A0ABS1TET9_9CLOT|nr:SMC-Scp complex subunit ScpB [Clostridium rhizosphaerae]MBL4937891.1 segregation/condensation protein B [Clostridium rhizosphaerae]
MTKMNMNQIEINEFSRKKLYFSVIEALLFVSGEPLKLREISNIIEQDMDSTKELIFELQRKYEGEDRGIMLISINDEYQLVSKPQNSDYIQKLLKTNTRQSLSQASLETLAIIAYKQPITRVSIDEIRGVKSDRAVLTLLDKGLIKEAGRMEVAGRPILYSTTEKFLLYFGLENLKQMPSLEEILKEEDIEIEENKSETETKE